MSEKKRPPIRISFKYNRDTGEIEEFIIDDNAPSAAEEYHRRIATVIAQEIGRDPVIMDAGHIRLPQIEPGLVTPAQNEDKEEERAKELEGPESQRD